MISDCYENPTGRRATIDLLDMMNRIGFRQSTLSGLSFATDDLITPPTKEKIIQAAEKSVLRIHKLYQAAALSPRASRYNPGAGRLDACPRADHLGNDGRHGKRPSTIR